MAGIPPQSRRTFTSSPDTLIQFPICYANDKRNSGRSAELTDKDKTQSQIRNFREKLNWEGNFEDMRSGS
jgi:hypothetical protein